MVQGSRGISTASKTTDRPRVSPARVHTARFTRRAYRSRTVRVGLPVYTLRPLRRVRPVHSDHIGRCSQWRQRRAVCACMQTDLFISTPLMFKLRIA